MFEHRPDPSKIVLTTHDGQATLTWTPKEQAGINYELAVSGMGIKEPCSIDILKSSITQIVQPVKLTAVNKNTWIIEVNQALTMVEKAQIMAVAISNTKFTPVHELPIPRTVSNA